jgi:hypothetical protein
MHVERLSRHVRGSTLAETLLSKFSMAARESADERRAPSPSAAIHGTVWASTGVDRPGRNSPTPVTAAKRPAPTAIQRRKFGER